MRTKTKTKKQNHVIDQDENGNLVLFEVPWAAIWYGYECVKLKDMDLVDDTQDELMEGVYAQNEN